MTRNSGNKAKILASASMLFERHGIAGLTVRAIASDAGVSTIGVYSHFKGKSGLIEALYQQGFELLGEAAWVPEDADESSDLIINLVNRYLDFAADHPAHYDLMFGPDAPDLDPETPAQLAALAAITRLATTIQRLLPKDRPSTEPRKLANQVWVAIHGHVTLRRRLPFSRLSEQEWREEVRQTIANIVAGARTESITPK
jgi:AcrR family transcriptional regulator